MLDSGITMDDLHYSPSAIDSYGKAYNFTISEREAGKTTARVAQTIYKAYKTKHRPALVLRNLSVDITEAYVQSFETTINKFKGREVELDFKKGDLSKGITMVYDKLDKDDRGKPRLFAVFAALSIPINRLKSINVGAMSCILYDEAIVAVGMGEKYPKDLAFKIKEIYRTFERECRPDILRFYALANPYSKYHPLLVDWKVPFLQMKRGSIITGKNWAVECYEMKSELREFIIKNDPTYQFDDAYTRYAFDGASIEDEQIPMEFKKPENYSLRYVFKLSNRYLYVWRANAQNPDYIPNYWIQATAEAPGKRQNLVCLDFTQLCSNGVLMDYYKGFFGALKYSVALNRVLYADPEAYYLTQVIYGAA